MPDQIFISYRRDDAAYVTGHINDLLRKEFGEESVFTDVDNIALGVDFRAVLDESVSQCQVLLAVIGDNWLTVRSRDGKPRLDDPADFVRIEIESALKRNIPVIPLLVSGATMPLEEDLPGSLKDLAFRNGTQIRPAPDFNLDMDRLIRNLRAYLQSMRSDGGQEQPELDSILGDKTEQQPSQAEPELPQAAKTKRSDTAAGKMLVGEEERARKQVELGIDHPPSKKNRATWISLVAIVALAGAAWYYVDQNPEQLEAVLTVVQPSSPEPEESLVTDEDAAATPADDADSAADSGEATFGAPTSFSAVGATDAEEDLTADLIDDATTVDEVETSPELTAEPSSEFAADSTDETSDNFGVPDEAGDDAEANFMAGTAEEVAESDGTFDGEITLTPRTQRRAEVSALLSEGVSLAAVGDHETAIERFGEALALDNEAPFLYKQRGASYQAIGQFEAAVRDYGEAILLNDEDLNAYYNRGASHFALQNYAATIADYDEVIRMDPELAEAYTKRADAHEALGNVGEAARDRATASVFESNRDNPR